MAFVVTVTAHTQIQYLVQLCSKILFAKVLHRVNAPFTFPMLQCTKCPLLNVRQIQLNEPLCTFTLCLKQDSVQWFKNGTPQHCN